MHSIYVASSSHLKYPDCLSDNLRQQALDIRLPPFCLDNGKRFRNDAPRTSLFEVKAYNPIIPALEFLGAIANGEGVSLWFRTESMLC